MSWVIRIVATFFGIGYFPIAPGTLASLIIVLLYKYYLYGLEWPYFLALLVTVFIIGVYSSTWYSRERKIEDPRTVVIDEILGQLFPLFLLPPEWPLLLAAFILFRFFDIVKPLYIKKAETFPTGWGIMMDDMVAGIYSGIIINIYLLLR